MIELKTVWVRGAGEMGSACALVLHNTGFKVFTSEREYPLAIRRTVTFSDAIYDGSAMVEGVLARRTAVEEVQSRLDGEEMPLVVDDPERILSLVHPEIVVDARLMKVGDDLRQLAPLSIGLGPGFAGGGNCDAAIETMRGHELGRILWDRGTTADTGTPGLIGGETARRVLRSPASGYINWKVEFGADVEEGALLGEVGGEELRSPFAGRVRGMIHPQTPVTRELKVGDVDPRGSEVDIHVVSDKARSVGRAVLEAALILSGRS